MLCEDTFLSRSFTAVVASALFVFTLAGAAVAGPPVADSPTELLEKAIYTEETVGDLDGAIEAYQKVLSASEPAIDAAAEAQYRIGACLARQGKTKMAAKAFQAVADNHGASKAWVKRAAEQLATLNQLLPIPWGDGDELHMHLKLPDGRAIGYQVFRVAKKNVDGKDYWECQNWQAVTLSNVGGKSRVLADFDSFAPIESHWHHSLLGTASAEFSSSEAAITMAGKDEVKTLKLEPPSYDNEQAAQVFRRLPLAKGYEGKIDVVPTLTLALIPIELKVPKVETIKVPAGEYECFRLELSIGQTFWISTSEKREIVRFEGAGVEGELVEVRQSDAKPKTIGGDRFSLKLAEGWHAYAPEDSGKSVFLIDPDNSIGTHLRTKKIKVAQKKFDSPEASLKDKVSDIKKDYKNASIKESDIKKVTVAGHPAAVVDFQFDVGKKRVHRRRMLVYGNKFSVNLKFTFPADQFDAELPKIEKLVESLQLD